MNRVFPAGSKKIALAVLAAAILLACTVETRHRVLTFFFDGVPPLEKEAPPEPARRYEPLPPAVLPAVEEKTTTLTLFSADPEARRRVLGEENLRHYQMPRRDCLICHDETQGLKPVAVVSREFCDQCHGEQRKTEGWNHGPINLGECLPCHRPGHEAPYPKLLDKPVAELCDFCHRPDGEKQMPIHKSGAMRVDMKDCTHCHDPHRVF